MNPNTIATLRLIGSGLIAGATFGVVARFATEPKTLKYAAVGAAIGGTVYLLAGLMLKKALTGATAAGK